MRSNAILTNERNRVSEVIGFVHPLHSRGPIGESSIQAAVFQIGPIDSSSIDPYLLGFSDSVRVRIVFPIRADHGSISALSIACEATGESADTPPTL